MNRLKFGVGVPVTPLGAKVSSVVAPWVSVVIVTLPLTLRYVVSMAWLLIREYPTLLRENTSKVYWVFGVKPVLWYELLVTVAIVTPSFRMS